MTETRYKAALIIDIQSYWHAGGGRGTGLVLDNNCHRDSDGLPIIPGKHIKGLLRDAVERADNWGWFNTSSASIAAVLFGDRTETLEGGSPRPGLLNVSDGRLPATVADWLRSRDGQPHIRALFRSMHSTAINEKTGVADDRSLRGIELVVPLQLMATINIQRHIGVSQVKETERSQVRSHWTQYLSDALPLIDSVGGHRHRGLGRATLSLENSL